MKRRILFSLSIITRRTGRPCGLLIALLLGNYAPPLSANPAKATGIWLDRDEEVAVQIFRCRSNLCGRIVWLDDPDNDAGQLKRDRQNPNPEKRDRPLCGLRVLQGLEQTGSKTWKDGQIYNPENGQTYHSWVTLTAPDKLKIRGYVWLPLFGRTMVWNRIESPPEPCDPSVRIPSTPSP